MCNSSRARARIYLCMCVCVRARSALFYRLLGEIQDTGCKWITERGTRRVCRAITCFQLERRFTRARNLSRMSPVKMAVTVISLRGIKYRDFQPLFLLLLSPSLSPILPDNITDSIYRVPGFPRVLPRDFLSIFFVVLFHLSA